MYIFESYKNIMFCALKIEKSNTLFEILKKSRFQNSNKNKMKKRERVRVNVFYDNSISVNSYELT